MFEHSYAMMDSYTGYNCWTLFYWRKKEINFSKNSSIESFQKSSNQPTRRNNTPWNYICRRLSWPVPQCFHVVVFYTPGPPPFSPYFLVNKLISARDYLSTRQTTQTFHALIYALMKPVMCAENERRWRTYTRKIATN